MRKLMMLFEDPTPANLTPAKLDHRTAHPLQTTYIIPGYSNLYPYDQYRYGLALASAMARKENPEMDFDQASALNINMTLTPYSKGDDEIIRLANVLLGAKAKAVNSQGSHEPKDTYTVSPVANWRKK